MTVLKFCIGEESSFKHRTAHHWWNVWYGYPYKCFEERFNIRVREFCKRVSCVHGNLGSFHWRVFKMQERANQRSGQDWCCCSSYQFSVQRNRGWTCAEKYLQDRIHVFIPTKLWCRRAAGYGLEVPSSFYFYGPEKAINWMKIKLSRVQDKLKENIKYCLK